MLTIVEKQTLPVEIRESSLTVVFKKKKKVTDGWAPDKGQRVLETENSSSFSLSLYTYISLSLHLSLSLLLSLSPSVSLSLPLSLSLSPLLPL